MLKLGAFLGATDYVVILASLVACMGVGIYHQTRKRKVQTEEFFLGGRKMTIFPIAISMLATSMTAVPIVSGSAEIYRHGMEYCFLTLGMQVGKLIAAYSIVPVFRYFQYISIYEYFEKRFDRSVRLGISAAYLVMNLFQAAVVLYLPTLLLTTVTGIPYWVMAGFSGTICTIYCILGGFRTVVWTDVLQFCLMFASLFAVILVGTTATGGVTFVWNTAFRDTFFKHLSWLDTEGKRFTVLSSLIFGIFLSLQNHAINQAVIQRLLSVVDIKAAQRSLLLTFGFGIFFTSLILVSGAILYSVFYLCDPLQRPAQTGVTSLDLVLLYFVKSFLSVYPGISGIVIAGILSSSLSTISSYINSFAAITLEDVIRPQLKRELKEQKAVLISKLLTAGYGTLVTLLSFLIPFMGGAMKAMVSILGAIGGPLTGMMFLAIFVIRAEKKACLVGLMCGIGLCLWLSIGSLMHRTPLVTLPLSTQDCPTLNVTDTSNQYLLYNISSHAANTTSINRRGYVFPLYKISFVWYGPLGLLTTFVIGMFLSYLQKDESERVDQRLLSPLVRKCKLFTHELVTQTYKESVEDQT